MEKIIYYKPNLYSQKIQQKFHLNFQEKVIKKLCHFLKQKLSLHNWEIHKDKIISQIKGGENIPCSSGLYMNF